MGTQQSAPVQLKTGFIYLHALNFEKTLNFSVKSQLVTKNWLDKQGHQHVSQE